MEAKEGNDNRCDWTIKLLCVKHFLKGNLNQRKNIDSKHFYKSEYLSIL